MTEPTTATEAGAAVPSPGDDHQPADFSYGHGRMPFFMKLIWLAFLVFGAWYMVSFLLDALGTELQ